MQSSNPTIKQAIRSMEHSTGRCQAIDGIGRHRRDQSRGTGFPTQGGRTSRDERDSSLRSGPLHDTSRRERPHTADARNKRTKTALDELSKATATVKQSQQARRLDDAKTKLSDAITQAEDLYQHTEANTDTNVSETRVSLGAQLDTARNTLHTITDIAALNKAADDLNAFTQRLSDAIKQAEEAPSVPAEPSGASESEPTPIQRQPSTSTTHPTPAAPATPRPAPQPSPSAPSWDVPGVDASSTFPDTL